jgi:Ca-activated chloride channel family protein
VSKHRPPARRRRRGFGLLTVLVLAVALVLAGPSVARRLGLSVSLPWNQPAAASCSETAISIVVAPELQAAVDAIVRPLQGTRLADGSCLQATVTAEDSAATVRKAQLLPPDRAPQLWIPDSSLWIRQVDQWPLQTETSFASSPLIIATSGAVVGQLGWAANPPTWAQALSGVRPVAMPNLQSNASGVLAVLGLWQSLGKTAAADQAVAAAALASTRSTAPTPSVVVDAAVKNDPATPLLVTSEVNVFTTNRSTSGSRMVAVYPRDGSPSLDYPVLRVAPRLQGVSRSIATDTVVGALEGAAARDIVRRNGFRDATGTGSGGAGVSSSAVTALTIPDPAATTAFLERLQSLVRPSHIMVVVDVSLSMASLIGGRVTRAQLAGQAAIGAGNLLSDASSVGLWVFSRDLTPGVHYRQLDALAPLGSKEGTQTHRDAVDAHLANLTADLGGDGTALYSTSLAAMKIATREYDPSAVNSVVLFTDGVNDDQGGISLTQLVTQLKGLADPQKPVRLIAIGIGPDADLTVLKQMVAPSSGDAYVATSPDQLKTILFDALAHRQN